MIISLHNISKRFNYDWIFRNVQHSFSSPLTTAVTGSNGSGKSTLLKIIAGQLTPSSGTIRYELGGKIMPVDTIYQYLSYAAPYMELIEEFTLSEIIHFHLQFKKLQPGIDKKDIPDIIELSGQKNKELKYFSSGMKQRVKLALTMLSDTPLLLLDEPTTNLDTGGVNWYLKMIEQFTQNRTLIISSNMEREYSFCTDRVDIALYK
ncbi:MAG: ABC transporter ATP-binding protein [Chitinophagales bacterium]|nr:ABC transporter ATP-binding protein [Chitinophagales bacterium]